MPIDDLNSNEFAKLIRRIERLERAAPVGYSSVTSGALEISSPEGLIVDGTAKVSGELDVTGTLNVSGILKGLGSLLWDGIITLTSAFTARGTTRFEGDTSQVGPFHVAGATDLTGNLTVATGGTITVGTSNPVVIGPGNPFGPGMLFSTGAYVSSTSAGAALFAAGAASSVAVSPANAAMLGPGSWVIASASGVDIHGAITADSTLTMSGIPSKSAAGLTPNLWVDSTGKIWKLI